MKQIILALTLTITALAPATRATPLQWTLYKITFADGGGANGAFTFDADTTTLTTIALSTTAGSAFSGVSYSVVPPPSAYQPGPSALFFATGMLKDYTGSTLLFLQMDDPLTDTGGALPLIAVEYRCTNATCLDANPLRTGTGFVTTLPSRHRPRSSVWGSRLCSAASTGGAGIRSACISVEGVASAKP